MAYSSYNLNKRDYRGNGATSSYQGFYNKQMSHNSRITIPTPSQGHDDKILMEMEVQLEALKSLFQKNESYGNKLRASLQKINQKHKENTEKLKELNAQKHEIQQKAKVNRFGYSCTYGTNLYGHKIQGISFYQFENYQRLDCIQAFELMSKKNNKILKQSHHHLHLNNYYSYDCDQVIDSKKRDKFQSFFDKLPQIKDQFAKQQKQYTQQAAPVNRQSPSPYFKEESLSLSSEEKSKNSNNNNNNNNNQIENQSVLYQECIENQKKEFINLLIFNFLDEQLEQSRKKDQSSSNGIKKEQFAAVSTLSLEDFVKSILSSNIPIYHWIDWIEFAKFGNLMLNKYGAAPIIGYVEALEIFSTFKALFTRIGDELINLIMLQNRQEDSQKITSLSQQPIRIKQGKRSNKQVPKSVCAAAVGLYEDAIRKINKTGTKIENDNISNESTQIKKAVNNNNNNNLLNTLLKPQNEQASEWTRQDDEKLMRAVQIFGEKRWGQVSTQLNGKEHTDIVQRWVKFLNPRIEKGRWSLREDLKLAILYEFYYQSKQKMENKTWCLIANHFTNRTEVQIRERWCNLLDPKMKFTSWSKEEDALLLDLGVKFEGQWAKISRELENKTDNQVLRRWKLLLSDRYNSNMIKGVDFSNVILRNEYLRHHGLIEEEQFSQNKIQSLEQNICNENTFNMKQEQPSQFLPQIKIEQNINIYQIPEPRNLFKEISFSPYQYQVNMQDEQKPKQYQTEIAQPSSKNVRFFTLKSNNDDDDDNGMEIENIKREYQPFQSQSEIMQTSNAIIRVPSDISIIPPKTKIIFKLIKLTPALSNQIRKDNNKRREKKKYKKRPLGQKQKNFIVNSTTHIDNTSTFRSNYDDDDEDDDDDDESQSGMNFTEYQSETNNEPSSYNTSSIVGLKLKKPISKKLALPISLKPQSQLKIQKGNEEEDGYQSESEGSDNIDNEIPS